MSALGVVLLVLIAQQAAPTLVFLAMSAVAGGWADFGDSFDLAPVVATPLAALLVYAFVVRREPEPSCFALRWPAKPWLGRATLALLLLVAAAFAVFVFVQPLLPPPITLPPLPLPETLLLAATAVLLGPPAEEFIYRGVLFGLLAPRLGVWASAVLVTAVFVLMHIGSHGAVGLIQVGLVGALTIWLRIRHGSIVPGVLVHAGYNLLPAAGSVLLVL